MYDASKILNMLTMFEIPEKFTIFEAKSRRDFITDKIFSEAVEKYSHNPKCYVQSTNHISAEIYIPLTSNGVKHYT